MTSLLVVATPKKIILSVDSGTSNRMKRTESIKIVEIGKHMAISLAGLASYLSYSEGNFYHKDRLPRGKCRRRFLDSKGKIKFKHIPC